MTLLSTKYTLAPQSRDPDVMDWYWKMEGSFWTISEVDLSADVADWEGKLTEEERSFVKHVLAFFAASDGVVGENALTRFFVESERADVRCVYAFQAMIENVHSLMYSALIDTLVREPEEADRLFGAIEAMPCVARKARWAIEWMQSDAPFPTRLVAFACTEGIFFSASFCAIFWLKKRQLMPGLTFSNELISRDEGMHCDFACFQYGRCDERLSDGEAHAIVAEAVEVEEGFVADALSVRLIGMNEEQMAEYVRFCADRLLVELGHPRLYSASNPFPWMETISMQRKTNFFESRVSEYQKAGSVANREEARLREFVTTEEF